MVELRQWSVGDRAPGRDVETVIDRFGDVVYRMGRRWASDPYAMDGGGPWSTLLDHSGPVVESPYVRGERFPGAWVWRLVGRAGAEEIRAAVGRAAAICPLSGVIAPTGEGETRITLLRHPSVEHGVPDVDRCRGAAMALLDDLGWRGDNAGRPSGVVTAVGLREGYDAHAVVHSPTVVTAHVPGVLGSWFSARVIDGGVRRYEEPCVLVVGPKPLLVPTVRAAAATGQHQIVVADVDGRSTYTLHRKEK